MTYSYNPLASLGLDKSIPLDGSGKIPSGYLPSYVDDVLEYDDLASFPGTGETGKIYVAIDTGFTYRWSGSAYVRINSFDSITGDVNVAADGTSSIATGAIVDADINASAAIAGTKIQAATTSNAGAVQLEDSTASTSTTTAATPNAVKTAYDLAAAALAPADIGVTVQGYDADTAKLDVAQAFTAEQTFGELKETVYTLGTSGTIALDPANGSIQSSVLAGAPTFTDSLEAGQTIVLMLENGASYTVTWPTITWVTSGGNVAPTLTAKDTLVLWKVSTTLYGAYVGSYV